MISNGYHPIPIAPDSKAPSEWRGGKWRGMSGWQKYRTELPKDFLIKVWSNWPDANVGIVTGTVVTVKAVKDNKVVMLKFIVVAIDFDTDDYDTLQELEASLPYSGVRKKGRRGHTSFYLAPVGTPGFRTPIVELLTDTRQTVIAPSIHPDTGKPYIWTTAQTLLNTPAHDLPVLTAEDLERFRDTVESITKKPLKPVEPVFQQVEPGDDKFWRLLNNTAYMNLDMWVPELGLMKLKREANGGYKAVAHWRESTTGRDLRDRSPNLSIAPNLGARDFGTGDRYTAINLVMVALDINLDDAVKWLGTRVKMIHETKFHVPPITVEGDEEAQSQTPSENSTGSETPEEEVVDSTMEDAEIMEEKPHAYDERPEKEPAENSAQGSGMEGNPASDKEFPSSLLNPPGLVGEIMDWIVGGARRPSPMLALGPALTTVGTLMGANVRGPTRSASHLYVVGLAPSGAGKDYPLQAIGKLLKASTCGHLLGPSEFMSMSGVINFLHRQSLSVCAMDEFGAFLRKLNSKNSSTHEQGISKILRSIWGISFGDYMTPEWAGRASVEIQRP
ncbi:MAG: bifunctional DNA primase/polymerase, partial [Verrucomicrobiaceae bacterium]